MTLHVVALPHTHPDGTFPSCAYTGKIERFCRMMYGEGQRVVLYAGARGPTWHGTGLEGFEHVPLFTEDERQAWYPDGAADRIQQGDYTDLTWDPDARPWRLMNARAVAAIVERAEPRDVLCLIAGLAQKPVADALPSLLPLEWGIGYEGVFAPYRVYESYAWMHWLYGKHAISDGRFYDAVIPNFFDPADFEVDGPSTDAVWEDVGQPSPGEYLLFVGRCTARKGVRVAGQIAERAGLPLVVAGFGARWEGDERDVLVDDAGNRIGSSSGVRYVGPVGPGLRAQLMVGARALLAPTLYIEPFGGVAVEAMLSGTPAVTTDFGAFSETVEEGITGARFHTLAEGVLAVERAAALDPLRARERAVERFAMANVAPRYSDVLARLDGLHGVGWHA